MMNSSEREQARKHLLQSIDAIDATMGNQRASVGAVLDLIKTIILPNMFDLGDEVRARLDLLEAQALNYRGVHDKGAQYDSGDLCTYRGGLWHCNTVTKDAPGTSSAWRLMAKTPVAIRGPKK